MKTNSIILIAAIGLVLWLLAKQPQSKVSLVASPVSPGSPFAKPQTGAVASAAGNRAAQIASATSLLSQLAALFKKQPTSGGGGKAQNPPISKPPQSPTGSSVSSDKPINFSDVTGPNYDPFEGDTSGLWDQGTGGITDYATADVSQFTTEQEFESFASDFGDAYDFGSPTDFSSSESNIADFSYEEPQ